MTFKTKMLHFKKHSS